MSIAADDFKFALNNRVTGSGEIGVFNISGESKVRFAVENADTGNIVTISGKILNSNIFTVLGTVEGTSTAAFNVSSFDEIKVEVTTYATLSNYIQVISSSFNEASGAAISVDVPAGDNLSDIELLTFKSSDSSVQIIGDNADNSVDLTVSPSISDNYTPANPSDWNPVPTTKSSALDQLAQSIYDKTYKVEKFTLSAGDISNKYVTLGEAPITATKTRMEVINGLEQDYGVDFTVSSNQVGWNTLGLDGILVAGDKLIITYS